MKHFASFSKCEAILFWWTYACSKKPDAWPTSQQIFHKFKKFARYSGRQKRRKDRIFKNIRLKIKWCLKKTLNFFSSDNLRSKQRNSRPKYKQNKERSMLKEKNCSFEKVRSRKVSKSKKRHAGRSSRQSGWGTWKSRAVSRSRKWFVGIKQESVYLTLKQ